MDKSELSLNIFTLNCWGIPYVSANRCARIKAIADYLAIGKHDVVCLQELWSEHDFLFIKERVKSVLPYSHYFYSGVAGSGLAVLSTWHIEDVFFHQWALNGYVHKIQHGDWFGGKGVGVCRLGTPHFSVNVFCAHFVAEYGSDAEYEAHRIVQALSVAQLLRLSDADVSVLAADLNTEPHERVYRLMCETGGLHDAVSPNLAAPTCQHPDNSYTKPSHGPPQRLDHILYCTRPSVKVEVRESTRPLTSRVPGAKFSYSDHDAVCAELTVRWVSEEPAARARDRRAAAPRASVAVLRDARDVCLQAMADARRTRAAHLVVAVLVVGLLIAGVGHDWVRLAAAGCVIYCVVMATLWHLTELNALKACICTLDDKLLIAASGAPPSRDSPAPERPLPAVGP